MEPNDSRNGRCFFISVFIVYSRIHFLFGPKIQKRIKDFRLDLSLGSEL